MGELQDKVILVTGGNSGIGEAIARCATREGARVAIVGLDRKSADALARELPGSRAYIADVSDAQAMEQACTEIVSDFGRLDGAVNNAGIGGDWGTIVDCSLENWDRTLAVNLSGVFYSLRAEVPHLLASGGGAIVNMASMAGILGEPALPAYIAAKHGVVGLTKSVALDFGRQGIRCNAVCPTFVKTPMTEAGIPDPAFWESIGPRHPIGRIVTAQEVAETTVFLLSDRAGGMTGSVHLVDGGIAAE